MRGTTVPLLVTAAGVAAVLTACSSAAAATVHRGKAYPVQPGSVTAADVATAQTAFGVDLLHAVCAVQPERNVLLSPTSAGEALGLLYPATGGPTAEAFARLLHLPRWSPDLVAATQAHTHAIAALHYEGDLDEETAPDALLMSNRLWTAPGVRPAKGYLDDVATAFDAELRSVDFAGDPGGATDRINQTVDEDTRGLIEKLFDDDLGRDTRVVLTNALYLKAHWADPFDSTDDVPFAAPSGTVTVDLMAGAVGLGRSAAGWRSVELPYRDGSLAAVAVLPPEGTDPCAVDAASLSALDDAATERVGVRLPRLKVEQTHQLLGVLEGMGLPVSGDFSGLGENGLAITEVIQKTFLEVDEEGTEAAAATGIAAGAAAPVIPDETITFDRPFLFLLTDTKTRSPLFVSVVTDPST